MGWFDGLLGGGGGGGGGVDYAGLLSGSGNIDYNKLLQQELANADNAKWGALAGALAEAGQPSRLPIPIGSAIGKAAAAFSGSDNNSLLKILQIQKLATETQSLKELSELRKSLPADMRGLMDDIVKIGAAPGAGQPNEPAGDGAASGTRTPTGGGGGTLTGEAIPIGQPGNPGSLAMEHPPEVQEQVAKKIATSSGLQHWAGEWNPKLQADLRAAGLPLSGPVSEEQWNAAKPMILARESMGGKNIPNYRFDATHTAGGPFQITNSTFRAFGGPDIAAAANAAASDRPLPSAFNLPKFSGLLGESTDAEQPLISKVVPDAAAGAALMSLPSQQEIGPPPNRARASPEAMRRAWPTGPGAPPLPPELGGPAPVRTSMYPPPTPGQLATLAAMRGGDTMGGGNTEGALPGDLVTQMTPGQGPLAIPRPAGLPPMPVAPVAPPGGLLVPPQAPVAPPAGPGLLAAPQAPPGVPAAPPAVRSGPSYMPQMPAGMNEQQMLALQARVAQLRAKAALGGITGDPFAGYADLLKNSPNALRQKAIIDELAKFYGPGASPGLQGALEIEKNRAKYYSPEYDPAAVAGAAFGKRAGENPFVEKEKTQATEEDIRKAERTEFEDRYGINPATGRLEVYRVRKGDIPSASAAPAPAPVPGTAPGAPAGAPAGSAGKPVYTPLEQAFATDLVTKSKPAAQGAAQALQFTGMAKDLLDKGVFTGAGAGLKLQVAKAAQLFPGDWSNERIANTETFIATQARQVASFLASGALGTGQSITDNDRKFAEGIAAGNIALDEKSLRNLIDINEKYARSALNQHNDSVKSFDPTAKYLLVPEPTPLELPGGGGGGASRPSQTMQPTATSPSGRRFSP